MRAKIDIFTPKNIKNSGKASDFAVCWAESDSGIEILLHGVVGDEYTQTDAGSISRILSANKTKPVTMRVNSFGGLAFDGLAIFNALAEHPAHTTGIIESVAASAASLAVIGADTVKMQANAVYQIHEGIAGAWGHIADLRDVIDWLEKFNAAAVDTYAAKTGKSVDVISKALLGANGDGTKYTAQEAFDMGFVDEVIPIAKSTKPKAAAKNDTLERKLTARILAAKLDCLK
jgi:ATP-dependent Clp protease protease subunit